MEPMIGHFIQDAIIRSNIAILRLLPLGTSLHHELQKKNCKKKRPVWIAFASLR